MSLTDILKNTAYAFAASSALAGTLYTNPSYSAENEKPSKSARSIESKTKYSLEDFKKAYGENWNMIGSVREGFIKERWDEMPEELRKDVIGIYENPMDFYKNRLNEEDKKQYDMLVKAIKIPAKDRPRPNKVKIKGPSGIPLEKIAAIIFQKYFPWIIDIDNPSEKELLTLYADQMQKEKEEAEEKEKKERESKEMTEKLKGLFKE